MYIALGGGLFAARSVVRKQSAVRAGSAAWRLRSLVLLETVLALVLSGRGRPQTRLRQESCGTELQLDKESGREIPTSEASSNSSVLLTSILPITCLEEV